MSTDARALAEPLLGFADSLPTVASDAAAPASLLHLLTFSLDREEFGIPVTQVREVIRVDGITRVPQVPARQVRGAQVVVDVRAAEATGEQLLVARLRAGIVLLEEGLVGLLEEELGLLG